jgi:hypothetical protein
MKLIMSIRKKIANNFLTFSIVVALLVTSVYMIYKHSYVAICNREASQLAHDYAEKAYDESLLDAITAKESAYANCMRKKGFEV